MNHYAINYRCSNDIESTSIQEQKKKKANALRLLNFIESSGGMTNSIHLQYSIKHDITHSHTKYSLPFFLRSSFSYIFSIYTTNILSFIISRKYFAIITVYT